MARKLRAGRNRAIQKKARQNISVITLLHTILQTKALALAYGQARSRASLVYRGARMS